MPRPPIKKPDVPDPPEPPPEEDDFEKQIAVLIEHLAADERFRGPQGEPGVPGKNGAPGPPGPQGKDGADADTKALEDKIKNMTFDMELILPGGETYHGEVHADGGMLKLDLSSLGDR